MSQLWRRVLPIITTCQVRVEAKKRSSFRIFDDRSNLAFPALIWLNKPNLGVSSENPKQYLVKILFDGAARPNKNFTRSPPQSPHKIEDTLASFQGRLRIPCVAASMVPPSSQTLPAASFWLYRHHKEPPPPRPLTVLSLRPQSTP